MISIDAGVVQDEFLLRVADGEDYDEKEKEFAHLKRLSDVGLK